MQCPTCNKHLNLRKGGRTAEHNGEETWVNNYTCTGTDKHDWHQFINDRRFYAGHWKSPAELNRGTLHGFDDYELNRDDRAMEQQRQAYEEGRLRAAMRRATGQDLIDEILRGDD